MHCFVCLLPTRCFLFHQWILTGQEVYRHRPVKRPQAKGYCQDDWNTIAQTLPFVRNFYTDLLVGIAHPSLRASVGAIQPASRLMQLFLVASSHPHRQLVHSWMFQLPLVSTSVSAADASGRSRLRGI